MEGGHPLSYDNCMYTAVKTREEVQILADKPEWKVRECDTCCDPGLCQTCCLAIVCPCVVVDAIVNKDDENNPGNIGSVECCLYEGCTALCPGMSFLQSVLSCCNLAVGASWLCPVGHLMTCATACAMSRSIRNEYTNRPHMDPCEVCCCSFFCPCMSLSKMYRQVQPDYETEGVDCCYIFNMCNH